MLSSDNSTSLRKDTVPGSRIPFACTHLQAKFLSQQPEYKSQRSELEYASLFNYVEKQIISEVIDRGRFLRWKSFIDGTVAPMIEFSDKLLDFSAQNSKNGRVLRSRLKTPVSILSAKKKAQTQARLTL